jgi:hypothetical protein
VLEEVGDFLERKPLLNKRAAHPLDFGIAHNLRRPDRRKEGKSLTSVVMPGIRDRTKRAR